MKTILKFILLFIVIITVFSSCGSYEVMYYKNTEIAKVGDNVEQYTVYLHDKSSIYKVERPNFTNTGIKGDLTTISDPAAIAEIKNPKTHKQKKKHKYDLNVYTKTEINSGTGTLDLKKDDITSVSHVGKGTKTTVGEGIATGLILGVGVCVWVGIFAAFQGNL